MMNTDNLKILVVLQVIGDTGDCKSIAMLQQAGFIVEAVAFERDYHVGRMPDCPIERLGKIAHGHYFQRKSRQHYLYFLWSSNSKGFQYIP